MADWMMRRLSMVGAHAQLGQVDTWRGRAVGMPGLPSQVQCCMHPPVSWSVHDSQPSEQAVGEHGQA